MPLRPGGKTQSRTPDSGTFVVWKVIARYVVSLRQWQMWAGVVKKAPTGQLKRVSPRLSDGEEEPKQADGTSSRTAYKRSDQEVAAGRQVSQLAGG